MYHVGIDVHQSRSNVVILNQNGATHKSFQVKGGWPKLLEALKDVPEPFQVCYEASCGYGYLYDALSPLARRVAVAHPGNLRLIFRSKRKNDRVDASKIAKLLYLDEVPQIHVPCLDVRAWRGLITFRRRILGKRTGIKSQLKALLRGLGIAAPRSLWTRQGQAWLKELKLQTRLDQLRRDMLLDDLAQANVKLRQLEKELAVYADKHPGVRLLLTIPGVGIRTAEAVVAWIDDPNRFARINQAGAYFGLIPCQDQSAGVNRLGHITGDGPAVVRWLLAEASWQATRRSATVRAFHDRVMRGDPDRKKIALVATMHYLTRVMLAMLKSGEVWRESGVVGPAARGALPQTPPPEKDGLRPAVQSLTSGRVSQPQPRP